MQRRLARRGASLRAFPRRAWERDAPCALNGGGWRVEWGCSFFPARELTGALPMSDLEATAGDSGKASRRTFIKAASAAAVAAGAVGPTILGAEDKAGARNAVIGSGEHTYECLHNWGELPAHVQWGETHGVAIDEAGRLYYKNH